MGGMMGFGRIAVCRRWGVVGVVVLGMAGYLFAAAGQIQAASSQSSAVSTEQSFEVATIKPSAPDENARSLGWTGRRFTARYTTISQMVQFAYNLQAKQVVGVRYRRTGGGWRAIGGGVSGDDAAFAGGAAGDENALGVEDDVGV
jgi:hypothetical protein